LQTGGRCGAGAARNLGAKWASGEILFFTDADCVAPPDWISKAITSMQTHGVLCGGGGYAGPIQHIFPQRFAFEELLWRRRFHKGFVRTLVSNNLYCHKKVFFEAGGFPENYHAASSEDMEFSWKVSEKYKIWWDEENGVYHNFPDTISSYFQQQFRFARDAVPMLLGNTSIMKGNTHHGNHLYIETFLTIFILIAILFLQIRLATIALFLLLLINAEWLLYLRKERKAETSFILFAIFMIGLRNLAIVAGCSRGLLLCLKKPS
jgi:glycosyltransferase involved in cell wall biosynthesis